MGAVVTSLGVAAVVLAAVVGGVAAVAVVAVLLGVAAAVDGARLLARFGARPVLPAALVPVVALPVMAAGDAHAAWARVGSWYALTFLLAALLLLVSGRRVDATRGLGGTMALAGLVGLGSGAIVLLAGLRDGPVWVAALALLVLASDLPDRLLRLWARRRGREEPPLGRTVMAGALAGTVFVAAALGAALADQLWPPAVVVVAVVTVAAGRAAAVLWPASAPEAPVRALRSGGPLAATGTLLLAAPVVYLVVRAGVG